MTRISPTKSTGFKTFVIIFVIWIVLNHTIAYLAGNSDSPLVYGLEMFRVFQADAFASVARICPGQSYYACKDINDAVRVLLGLT